MCVLDVNEVRASTFTSFTTVTTTTCITLITLITRVQLIVTLFSAVFPLTLTCSASAPSEVRSHAKASCILSHLVLLSR
ncbi:hypothetical protein E2C01_042287 [Portunus trituberculatus]|uniref:Uncharacterized protein n=1 Tax=Portunus trituberculatus TaxID=210409 RepID=A0A5B7FU78_PORTR|nr:hypothetical protein [Portunus trituberculatus]